MTLEHYSPFFARKFGQLNTDADEIILPNISSDIFGYFVYWLVTQQLATVECKRLKLIEYAKLYTMTKAFEVYDLPNNILRLCMQNTKPTTQHGDTLLGFQKYAYEQGDKLLEEIAINKTMTSLFSNPNNASLLDQLPVEMTLPLLKAAVSRCILRPERTSYGNGESALDILRKRQHARRMNEEPDDAENNVAPPAKRTPKKK